MGLRAGFAAVDITPPLGIKKVGWLQDITADRILDPLYVRAAVFESEGGKVAFVQTDTISFSREDTAEARSRIGEAHGFPGANVLFTATHNHAGPAVKDSGMIRRDEDYVATYFDRIVEVFGEALSNRRDAEIGFGRALEWELSGCRRVVMRDGTVKTHGSFDHPDALFIEGPIDPEVMVLAARSVGSSGRPDGSARGEDGELLGCLVNFAMHPTQHGGDTTITAGYPGQLALGMKERGCPVTLFCQGAAGNLHAQDVRNLRPEGTMEHLGAKLAEDAAKAVESIEFRSDVKIGCASKTIEVPYREITDELKDGLGKGTQRFGAPGVYDITIGRLMEKVARSPVEPVEVQVLSFDGYAIAAIPAEYFVQHGLRIKEETYPTRTLVFGYANGMLGYVPHAEAFKRGGYETCLGGSNFVPEAGDMLADAAIELVKRLAQA